MDAAGNSSVLGLVELSEEHDVSNVYNATAFNVLRDAFHDRLKLWMRSKDQWRSLNHNQVCVILRDVTSGGELELAAAKLGRVFRDPHIHQGTPMPFSISAGFAEFDNKENDMGLAMRQAGIALNQAKLSSHLYEVYSHQEGLSREEEASLLDRLQDALELGEFHLYYQPKVHAGYQSLIGAEALLRWHTSDRQIITPDQFIDVAERNEIIQPITWWVIKSAVSRLTRWPTELSIAVNVPPSLLLEDDILSVVQDALDIYGVQPHRLNLEVTEKIMVEQQDKMLGQLHRLRDIGVKISIDDFGTGFSSLAYFRDLPVDEIKIDKSFVMRMLNSEKDAAIVRAVINLAHNFSLRVVAEGVENLAISNRLAEMGCDVLQGYVFDRPLPLEEFEREYKLR